MKKKFSIWLNIITICFCFAAIAIGVYAATNASLTVSGQIGFTAHNCKVNVTGYIYGHAQGTTPDEMKNGYPTLSPDEGGTPVYLTANNAPQEVTGQNNIISLGENRYFSDLNDNADGKPTDIYVVLQISNASTNYHVQATVDTTSLEFGKIKITPETTTAVLNKSGAAVQFKFKIELLAEEDGSYAEITGTLKSVSINMTFDRADNIIDHDIVQPVISSSYENFWLSQNDDGKTYTASLNIYNEDPFFYNLEEYFIPSRVKFNNVEYYITVVDFMDYNGAFYECNNVYICSGIQEVKNLYVDNIDNLHISKNLKKLTNCNFDSSTLDDKNNIYFGKDTIDLTIENCTFEGCDNVISIGENSNISFAEVVSFLSDTEINIGEGSNVSFDEGVTFSAPSTINILYQNVNVEFNGTEFSYSESGIFINLTTPPTGISFINCSFASETDLGIYVPTGYENVYKSASNFASVADYIKGYDFSA